MKIFVYSDKYRFTYNLPISNNNTPIPNHAAELLKSIFLAGWVYYVTVANFYVYNSYDRW